MSRKTILIIAAIAILLLVGGVYLATRTPSPTGTTSSGTGVFGSLFPFGNSNNGTTTTPGAGGTEPTPSGSDTGPTSTVTVPAHLVEISNKNAAGFGVLPADTSTPVAQVDINDPSGAQKIPAAALPSIRFAERGTGYIYDVDAHGQNAKKVSGTVVARTAEAYFDTTGSTAVMRYVKEDNATVATYLGHLVPSTDPSSPGTLKGDFLPDNLGDITFSPDKKSILFLLPTSNGIAGISMKTDGTSKKQLFSSSFSEWLLDWTTAGVAITTKASGATPGYAYLVNSSGVFKKILGAVNGLTTKISPDGKSMLYSESKSGSLNLHLRRMKDGLDMSLGLPTLPEKCAWAYDGTAIYCGADAAISSSLYPDAWYQGIVHFNDAIWKIDVTTGTTTEIDDGEGNFLDVAHPATDPTGKYLFFMDKNSGHLWSLDLSLAK